MISKFRPETEFLRGRVTYLVRDVSLTWYVMDAENLGRSIGQSEVRHAGIC